MLNAFGEKTDIPGTGTPDENHAILMRSTPTNSPHQSTAVARKMSKDIFKSSQSKSPSSRPVRQATVFKSPSSGPSRPPRGSSPLAIGCSSGKPLRPLSLPPAEDEMRHCRSDASCKAVIGSPNSRPANLPPVTKSSKLESDPADVVIQSNRLLESPLLVPITLLFAACYAHFFPEKGISVVLLLAALSTFGPTARPLYRLMVQIFEIVGVQASDSKILSALATKAMHAALQDPEVKKSFTAVCADSFTRSVQHESSQATMISCTTKSMLAAALTMTEDEDMLQTVNKIMRNGLKESLSDDTVVDSVLNIIQEGLRDPRLHKAAIRGVTAAANPLQDLSVPNVSVSELKESISESLTDQVRTAKSRLQDQRKAVLENLREARVEAEARSLANASGLSRAPPPVAAGPGETHERPKGRAQSSSDDLFMVSPLGSDSTS